MSNLRFISNFLTQNNTDGGFIGQFNTRKQGYLGNVFEEQANGTD